MNTMSRNIRLVPQANGQVYPLPIDRTSMVLPDGITQSVSNLTLNQIAAGSIAPAPRRKYVTMSRRVCSLVDGYEI